MKPRPTIAVLIALALALSGMAVAGCGEEHELEVPEGEPIELGEVHYNVQISRFLNPADPADEGYLEGVEVEASADELLFGVFLTVENESDTTVRIPENFQIVDTQGNSFDPLPADGPFALELGGTIPPGGELPEADTPAAAGAIGGSLIPFLIPEETTENRPLELRIPGPSGEDGVVELDI